MLHRFLGIFLLSGLSLLSSPSLAQEQRAPGTPRIGLDVALGYGRIKADERAYEEGDLLSRLIWTGSVPVMRVSARKELATGWMLSGRATINLGENGHMRDYDWLPEFTSSTAPDDWSHRSLHPGSALRHYVDVELALGRDMHRSERGRLSLQGGLKYTQASWDALGGSLIYSEDDFRDYVDSFPDGLRSVSYRQRHLGLFMGAEAVSDQGPLRLSAQLRAGVSLSPSEEDRHWLRDLRFEGDYNLMPFASLGLRADYDVREGMTVFGALDMQKYFSRRGDTLYSEISTGASDGRGKDGSSASLSATTITFGLDRRF